MPAVSDITAAVTIDRQDCVTLPLPQKARIHSQHIIDPSIGIDRVQKPLNSENLCVNRADPPRDSWKNPTDSSSFS